MSVTCSDCARFLRDDPADPTWGLCRARPGSFTTIGAAACRFFVPRRA